MKEDGYKILYAFAGPDFVRAKVQWNVLLSCACVLILLCGCATRSGKAARGPGLEQPRVCAFGKVGIAPDSGPATFSYQKAKGKLGSVKEAILDSAELGLSGPGAGVFVTGTVLSAFSDNSGCTSVGDPMFAAAVATAAGGVVAVSAALAGPAVGAKGLIRSLQKVSPSELAEREAALTEGLAQMSSPEPFRSALLQAGDEKIRGGLIQEVSGPDSSQRTGPALADVILEPKVDELRLEKAGITEGSYFLRIKTHVRLVKAADGKVLLEKQAEYRSGTALFLDWTFEGGIQGVAKTGYQVLARYYISQLLAETGEKTAGASARKNVDKVNKS